MTFLCELGFSFFLLIFVGHAASFFVVAGGRKIFHCISNYPKNTITLNINVYIYIYLCMLLISGFVWLSLYRSL